MRLAALLLSVLPLAAHAGEVWVTNEKDDTITVLDTDTLEVTRTIETGERPRGITFSSDFSRVYVCASDSDAVQVIDPGVGENPARPALGRGPRAVRARARRQAPLDRQRERRCDDRGRRRHPQGRRADRRRHRARGHGDLAGRKDRHHHLRNDQHGALDRHRDDAGLRQHPRQLAPAPRGVRQGRHRALGLVGDRRHDHRLRRGDPGGKGEDRLRDPRRERRPAPARRLQIPPTARPPSSRSARRTMSRRSTRRPSRSRSTSSSAGASGISPSRPTTRSSSPPTGFRAT